ncbi:acyltransferase [Bacillus cereus]|uniref:acyltransferase n=1 Tax=Bacillus cereus TaxID=1396 RepID=UPI001D1533B1|nr:acyltransferase [Bacillus cereus]MCC3686943.1 acyltransferase [Bacillus cereus]
MDSKRERNNFIDFIRAISILGVICIHVVGLSFSEESIGIGVLFMDNLFRFAVPFFMGILGFMTIKKYSSINSWWKFYRDKIFFIVLPFYIWAIYYYFTPNIYPYPNINEGKEHWWQILTGESEIQLYFMIAYLLFLLITPLVVFLYKKDKNNRFKFLCMGLVFCHLALLTYSDYIVWVEKSDFWYLHWNYSLPLHWLAYYLIGVLIALPGKNRFLAVIKKKGNHHFWLSLILYFIAVVCFLFSLRGLKPYATVQLFIVSLFALNFLYKLYLKIRKYKMINWLYYIGKNSFPIYLSHVIFIKYAFIAFGKQTGLIYDILIYIACIVFSIGYIGLHNSFFSKEVISNGFQKPSIFNK